MPDTFPEPYATIVALRHENCLEKDIAARLNMRTDQLSRICREWQEAHPAHLLPLPFLRRRAAQVARIRALRASGLDRDAIALEMGLSEPRIKHLMWFAGCHVKQRKNPVITGRSVYHRLCRKGAVPPLGSLGGMLDRLTPPEVSCLIARIGHHDKTLAETLANVLKECLDASADQSAG